MVFDTSDMMLESATGCLATCVESSRAVEAVRNFKLPGRTRVVVSRRGRAA